MHKIILHGIEQDNITSAGSEPVKTMNNTILSIGSVTHAIKAQRVLSDNNVPSKVVKTKLTKSGKGCVFGIETERMYSRTAERILDTYGIAYRTVSAESNND